MEEKTAVWLASANIPGYQLVIYGGFHSHWGEQTSIFHRIFPPAIGVPPGSKSLFGTSWLKREVLAKWQPSFPAQAMFGANLFIWKIGYGYNHNGMIVMLIMSNVYSLPVHGPNDKILSINHDCLSIIIRQPSTVESSVTVHHSNDHPKVSESRRYQQEECSGLRHCTSWSDLLLLQIFPDVHVQMLIVENISSQVGLSENGISGTPKFHGWSSCSPLKPPFWGLP